MAEAGLFGPSPWEVQQAQQQALSAAADAYGKMDDEARIRSGFYKAGGMLSGAIAGALGGKNVPMRQAQDVTEIQKGIDHSTSEGLMKGAALLKDTNPKLAMQYIQAAQAMKEKEAGISLKQAQATKALREPSFRDYEYERMLEILNDPDSTEEQKKLAQARIDALNTKSVRGGTAGGTGRAIKFDAAGGTYWLDPYTKKVTTIGGRELSPEEADKLIAASNDPGLQGQLATSKEGSKTVAKGAGEAQLALPKLSFQVGLTNQHLDEILKHPAFKSQVGATWTPGAGYVHGTEDAGFKARFQQIRGETFMSAYETLRGGGQITENETKQAGMALNRMDTATSEKEFRAALEDFRTSVNAGLKVMREKAAMGYQMPVSAQPAAPAQPAPAPAQPRSQPFNGITSPNQVRDLYRQGKMTKADANAVLGDMKKMGLF